jgi:DNA-binding LytR/AlgR family response regulator
MIIRPEASTAYLTRRARRTRRNYGGKQRGESHPSLPLPAIPYSLFPIPCSLPFLMRVLIVDDEPAARRRLALMLEELDEEVVGQAANGVEALEMARERAPDLLLLDVEMPEVDGFDVLRHLGEPRPLVVFQTAYDEYALRAFEHAALDYLVKPVTRAGLERALARALARARERLAAPSLPILDEQVAQALRAAAGVEAPRRRRLLVREGRGHRLVALDEVVRFSTDEGMSHAHLAAGGKHLTDYTLAELEARTGAAFVRVSRADLVRVDAVSRVTRNSDGSATLGLADGSTVHVSRRRTPEVWALLEG